MQILKMHFKCFTLNDDHNIYHLKKADHIDPPYWLGLLSNLHNLAFLLIQQGRLLLFQDVTTMNNDNDGKTV